MHDGVQRFDHLVTRSKRSVGDCMATKISENDPKLARHFNIPIISPISCLSHYLRVQLAISQYPLIPLWPPLTLTV